MWKRVLLGAALAACGGSPADTARTNPIVNPRITPAELARQDGGRPAYTRADVEFMAGMIPHHAQAVLIAGWAESHGAGASIRALTERIVVAQRDEIEFMQTWLRERGETVPDADLAHAGMPGMGYHQMPGMLTPQELAELDRSRGVDFDRRFLAAMIRHHEGAILMVEKLFASHGAAQDDNVFKFASDVHVDQITEIDFMSLMLAELTRGTRKP
jgi:uncharacterized protein (DUF305 family)